MTIELEGGQPAALALADGTVFWGRSFGAKTDINSPATGEVVFNTAMSGYQEIITDPSYTGQIVCFTCPHIGNVGCNDEDEESDHVHVRGVVIRDLSRIRSNFRSTIDFALYLKRANVMGLAGIDTRQLVKHLRDHGAQMGALAVGEHLNTDTLVDIARSKGSMIGQSLISQVTCDKPYTWNELPWSLRFGGYRYLSQDLLWSRPHVVALDCGVKRNILRLLLASGFRVTVVPAQYSAEQILALAPDALFISNGPGDPAALQEIVETIRALLGKFPTFGICLGHQLLGQALGGTTYKLPFGHRGGNHPVLDLRTQQVEITVQNHGFSIKPDSLKGSADLTHINLNDQTVEGLAAPDLRAFSIQYHPEASPGPHDARYLFQRFFEMVVGYS